MQNLTIDYTTDTNSRILSMNYTEIGGYNGELFVTYDNFGNMADLRDNSGNSAMAIIIDPNNALITQAQYNPADIDDPHSYRARQCFIGIEMWPGQDNRVYLQGHVVIPNDWGNVSTNGETTTYTTDIITKGGGDDVDVCGIQCGGSQVLVCDCYYKGQGVIKPIGSAVGGDCPDTKWMELYPGVLVEGKLDHKKCHCDDYYPQ